MRLRPPNPSNATPAIPHSTSGCPVWNAVNSPAATFARSAVGARVRARSVGCASSRQAGWSRSCPRPAPAPHAAAVPPTVQARQVSAQPVAPDPRVGTVFLGGDSLHVCTGGVLDSPGGNLIITAAHCMADGVDAAFVSGFNNDAAPEDVWHVDAVYLDPRWMASQDPLADFAIARVSRQSGGTVQAQAGGGPAPGA